MDTPLNIARVLLFTAVFALAISVFGNLLQRIRESGGNVRTAEFALPDLLITMVLCGHFLMLVFKGLILPPPEPVPGKAVLTIDGVLPGALQYVILVAGIAGFLRYRRVNLRLLLGLDRLPVWRAVVTAVGLIISALPLVMIMSLLTQAFLHETEPEQHLVKLFREVVRNSDHSSMLTVFIAAVVLAPLSEEFLFRGYFYGVLKRYLGAWPSALFTATLFAAIHLNINSLPSLLILAICLTIAYEATGSLLVPMLMHACFNFTQLIYLYWDARGPGG